MDGSSEADGGAAAGGCQHSRGGPVCDEVAHVLALWPHVVVAQHLIARCCLRLLSSGLGHAGRLGDERSAGGRRMGWVSAGATVPDLPSFSLLSRTGLMHANSHVASLQHVLPHSVEQCLTLATWVQAPRPALDPEVFQQHRLQQVVHHSWGYSCVGHC